MGMAKQVLRVAPVGTDRNHNRYWVFSKATPGIYIEKGMGNLLNRYWVFSKATPGIYIEKGMDNLH